MATSGVTSRQARTTDLDAVTETITLAFLTDPVWGVALVRDDGRTDHLSDYWRFFVEGSQRVGGVWLVDGAAAVSVWLPPGASELSDEQAARLDGYLEAQLGPRGAEEMRALLGRFDANHPRRESHGYLSLLATHPAHRGRGIGQALLADDLVRHDRLGIATYLESTNPGNDHRYVRAGYRPVGRFGAIRDDAPVTTMWRAVPA